MKKVFIKIDDVAAAEYVTGDTPSHGIFYPPHLKIFLKQGGVLKISEVENGGACFQEWYDILFPEPGWEMSK